MCYPIVDALFFRKPNENLWLKTVKVLFPIATYAIMRLEDPLFVQWLSDLRCQPKKFVRGLFPTISVTVTLGIPPDA